VKWGWIAVNPAVSASPPKLRTKEITPPSLADTRKLLATADDYDVELAALLRVLAATGARRGEVDREGHQVARSTSDLTRR
jgi:integrase